MDFKSLDLKQLLTFFGEESEGVKKPSNCPPVIHALSMCMVKKLSQRTGTTAVYVWMSSWAASVPQAQNHTMVGVGS